jgi:hypothetical protein
LRGSILSLIKDAISADAKVSENIFFNKLFILNLGCNPVDVRKETRKDRKRELKDDKNIMYKKQRLLDSDDEDLKISQK